MLGFVVGESFRSVGQVVVAHGLSSLVAAGIFPDQASNLCPALAEKSCIHYLKQSYPESENYEQVLQPLCPAARVTAVLGMDTTVKDI